jgi:separase
MVTDSGTLGMVSHLLGLLGFVLVKVKLLDVTRRLCEQHSGTSHDGQWRYRLETNNLFIIYLEGDIITSVDLAHEYVKLGKTAKVSTIYEQALIAIRNGGPSDEIRTIFLLRYAESLAIVNNVFRR